VDRLKRLQMEENKKVLLQQMDDNKARKTMEHEMKKEQLATSYGPEENPEVLQLMKERKAVEHKLYYE